MVSWASTITGVRSPGYVPRFPPYIPPTSHLRSRTPMNVLVLNVGSSTLKFQLVRTDAERMAANTDEKLARGKIERIGGEAVYTLRGPSGEPQRGTEQLRDHRAVVDFVVKWLVSDESGRRSPGRPTSTAVGHRVVHGGEQFTHSVRIDDEVDARDRGD